MKGDRQREGVAMAFIRRVARVGSEWGGLVRKGLGLSRVHSGSKERSVRCVRREKHIPGSEGRELLEQEEDTGVYRSVSGTGTWVVGCGYMGCLGCVSLSIQPVSLHFFTWWVVVFSRAIRKDQLKCLSTFQFSPALCAVIPWAKASYKPTEIPRVEKDSISLWVELRKCTAWHEYKKGKSLWPVLQQNICRRYSEDFIYLS